MPQTHNKRTTTSYVIYGKGSNYSNLVDFSISSWKRARKLNQIEVQRLQTTYDVITRHAQSVAARQEKLVSKLRRRLKDIEAYRRLLRDVSDGDKARIYLSKTDSELQQAILGKQAHMSPEIKAAHVRERHLERLKADDHALRCRSNWLSTIQ